MSTKIEYDFSKIVLKTVDEAEVTLSVLKRFIARFHFAAVADFYDLIGIDPVYDDNRWGWTDLQSATIRAVTGGYTIVFPQVINLSNKF